MPDLHYNTFICFADLTKLQNISVWVVMSIIILVTIQTVLQLKSCQGEVAVRQTQQEDELGPGIREE